MRSEKKTCLNGGRLMRGAGWKAVRADQCVEEDEGWRPAHFQGKMVDFNQTYNKIRLITLEAGTENDI